MTSKDAILAALPCTIAEMIDASGLTRNSINAKLGRMKAKGLIRISGWVRADSGQATAVYDAGSAPDAPYIRTGVSRSSMARHKRRPAEQSYRAAHAGESTVSYAVRLRPALAGVWA